MLQDIFTVLCVFSVIFHPFSCHENLNDAQFQPGQTGNVKFGEAKAPRYLLYEVNPGEGFNLRRDVYMRVANLVKMLNEDEPWILVLPPWGRMYHWRSNFRQNQIPWSTFFDMESLRRHVPVIEFTDYLKARGGDRVIEEIYYLQRYKEGWTGGQWEEKMDLRDCIDNTGFKQTVSDKLWEWWFWDYPGVYGVELKCLSVQAHAGFLKPFLMHNTTGRAVFLVRAEELIHGIYSEWSPEYWTARRSLVFAKHLRKIGDKYRAKKLNSTDESDNTIMDEDWTNMKRKPGEAKGGPYVAVHLRRQDFLRGHAKDVPSLSNAADQLKAILDKQGLETLFLATDAPEGEVTKLKGLLEGYTVNQYKPSKKTLEKYFDGGVAIIDQWICAHARYFVGTSQSTFSFRIHEEREILGFDASTTFNRLCGDNENDCERPSKWTIIY